MLSVTISEKGGIAKSRDFPKAEITVGRIQGNDIILPRGNVSKRHARFALQNGKVMLYDLQSTNGTFVNGVRIEAPRLVLPDDQVQIGDFVMELSVQAPASRSVTSRHKRISSKHKRIDEIRTETRDLDRKGFQATPAGLEQDRGATSIDNQAQPEPSSFPPTPTDPDAQQQIRQVDDRRGALSHLQRKINGQLIQSLDLKRLKVERLDDEQLWDRTERSVREIIAQMESRQEIPDWVDRELLVKDLVNEALGLGPLEDFLSDPSVDEIMVNHAKQIYIEREGKLILSDKIFSSDAAVLGVIERIAASVGRRIDESVPMVDARLKDGSRVNAIIPPLALRGPSLTIRKFRKEAMAFDDLIRYDSLNKPMAEFLETCVKARKNCIVSGGTGSGKTTTLNCLSAFIPETERIITVEDAAELQLKQQHVISLESRPPNIEGKGAISIRDLVRNCLRMRPDRIIVGECRGGESLDMLQAMNTGHEGSLTTVHANTPRDSLARLEILVMMSGMELPVRAIREQISSAIDVIIQQSRLADGSRKIVSITEVTGMEGEVITLQEIFCFRQDGFDQKGKIKGRFIASGFIPRFYEDLKQRGISLDMKIFKEG